MTHRIFKIMESHIITVYPLDDVWWWRVHAWEKIDDRSYRRVTDLLAEGHCRSKWHGYMMARCAVARLERS